VTDSTFEEARRCPRCGEPGEASGQHSISSRNRDGTRRQGITAGARLHQFFCRNSRCRWYNTPWEVQVNPDGTIPPADAPNRARVKLRPLDPALAVTMKDRFQSIHEESVRQGKEAGGR
jgi:hypothetical protein